MPEYTPSSRQLISHELAELQEAEAMEKEIRDYMERKQRPKGADSFAGQDSKPRVLLMSQHQYDDIVMWGKSIEEKKERKARMQLSHYLSMPQGQVHKGMRAVPTGARVPVGAREARREAAKGSTTSKKKKPAKKGKKR